MMMRPRLGLCLFKIAHSCLAYSPACRATTSACCSTWLSLLGAAAHGQLAWAISNSFPKFAVQYFSGMVAREACAPACTTRKREPLCLHCFQSSTEPNITKFRSNPSIPRSLAIWIRHPSISSWSGLFINTKLYQLKSKTISLRI